MDQVSLCRICLVKDIRMKSITNTHLQEIYESLIMKPFETGDNRPKVVCYICCAKLQNCYQLKKYCLRSEELFTRMLNSNVSEPVELEEKFHVNGLKVTAVKHLSVGLEEWKHTDFQVNLEALDILVDLEVKLEPLEDYHDTRKPTQTTQPSWEDTTLSNAKENAKAEDKEKEIEDNDYIKNNLEKYVLKETESTIKNSKISHSKYKPYTCDTCQQCFTNKVKLNVHSHTHSEKKPYQCNICTKSFAHKSTFKNHIRTHTGEKPYQCHVCEKSFSAKGNLGKHMRIHSLDKPFQCKVCTKSFSQKYTLKKHMFTHTGEKPYQCQLCEKCFSAKSGVACLAH